MVDALRGRKVVSVFGSSAVGPGSVEYERARRVGRSLAEAGLTVATGGFDGVMAAVCRGAREAGGHTVGLTLPAWGLQANPWVCEERPQETFVDRLVAMTTDADGYVALDGGIGTLTEFALAWSLLQTRTVLPRPLVAMGERWRRLLVVFGAELIVAPEHLELISVVERPEDVVDALWRGWGGR